MATRYDFVSGDTRSVLQVSLAHDADGTALDLTGYSAIKLRWRNQAGALQERDCTVVNLVGGVVSYQFAAGELEPATMQFEVEVTAASKTLSNLDLIEVMVRPALG